MAVAWLAAGSDRLVSTLVAATWWSALGDVVAAIGSTVAVMVTTRVAPGATVPRAHVTAAPTMLQVPPLADAYVVPAGSVSLTTTSWALAGPALVTVSV